MRHRATRAALVLLCLTLVPRLAFAHCDTVDGPVVQDARAALNSNDVTPVLKWVSPDKEAAIREAFQQARAVRALGPEPRALADRFFFETLVRVHREGEGEPYTGLKPAGTPVEPGIAASDDALEAASPEPLVKMVTAEVEQGLRRRYAAASEARKDAGKSIEQGRRYVAAYVEFMHYTEQLLEAASRGASHSEPTGHAH